MGVGGSSLMKCRIMSWLIATALMASLAGCEDPQQVGPVVPPGFDPEKPKASGEPAQAIGETGQAPKKTAKANAPNSPPTPIGKPTTTASGLTYETLKEGTGPTAVAGMTVSLHYTGTLTDGTVFDSSRSRNQPFQVQNIGEGQVIDGWNEGVPGMKVGERRKLTIPAKLAYGSKGSPPTIAPDATLIFDVELIEAK
jgi:FKBP-type peptidyl-prolyl cis-trans isomerase